MVKVIKRPFRTHGARVIGLLETAGVHHGENKAFSSSAWIRLENQRPPMVPAISIGSQLILSETLNFVTNTLECEI